MKFDGGRLWATVATIDDEMALEKRGDGTGVTLAQQIATALGIKPTEVDDGLVALAISRVTAIMQVRDKDDLERRRVEFDQVFAAWLDAFIVATRYAENTPAKEDFQCI